MLLLEGIGDPSNGHGGFSYLKMPQKVQTDQCSSKTKAQRAAINPAIENQKQVAGTEADLRRLKKDAIKQKLVDLGFAEDELKNKKRWDMVQMIKDYKMNSSKVSENLTEVERAELEARTSENQKFFRGERNTQKMQREVYQEKVNSIFKKQMEYHVFGPEFDKNKYQSSSENEDADQHVRANNCHIEDIPFTCTFMDGNDLHVQSLTDIPGYQKLLAAQFSDPKANNDDAKECEDKVISMLTNGENIDRRISVLKRTIHSVEDNSLTVVYTSDLKQIKKFQKRKKSKKAQYFPSKRQNMLSSFVSDQNLGYQLQPNNDNNNQSMLDTIRSPSQVSFSVKQPDNSSLLN